MAGLLRRIIGKILHPFKTEGTVQTIGPQDIAACRNDLILAINRQRQNIGVSPLTFSDTLNQMAQEWCDWMNQTGSLSHGDFQRRFDEKFSSSCGDENICIAPNVQEVMVLFNSDRAHYYNMMNRRMTHIGIGRAGDFWCVDFEGE